MRNVFVTLKTFHLKVELVIIECSEVELTEGNGLLDKVKFLLGRNGIYELAARKIRLYFCGFLTSVPYAFLAMESMKQFDEKGLNKFISICWGSDFFIKEFLKNKPWLSEPDEDFLGKELVDPNNNEVKIFLKDSMGEKLTPLKFFLLLP